MVAMGLNVLFGNYMQTYYACQVGYNTAAQLPASCTKTPQAHRKLASLRLRQVDGAISRPVCLLVISSDRGPIAHCEQNCGMVRWQFLRISTADDCESLHPTWRARHYENLGHQGQANARRVRMHVDAIITPRKRAQVAGLSTVFARDELGM